ncbi:MAG: hypothetical protein PHN74_00200 [Candidatus Pacebacteria bacterium]|nr:hypothetical protein [Candidatus Paceibacterota bacterium]
MAILSDRDKKQLLPAFLWAALLTVISLIWSVVLAYGLTVISDKGNIEGIGAILFVISILFPIVYYPLILYFALKNISKKLPMYEYRHKLFFCSYIVGFLIIIGTIISSISERKFVLGEIGILPLIISFIVPAIYKPKDDSSSK